MKKNCKNNGIWTRVTNLLIPEDYLMVEPDDEGWDKLVSTLKKGEVILYDSTHCFLFDARVVFMHRHSGKEFLKQIR